MPPVGENLLVDFPSKQSRATFAPLIRFRTFEERANKDQRLQVGPQVIAEEVAFQTLAQESSLNRDTVQHTFDRLVPGQQPLDPVHQPQRYGVRLPAIPVSGRILRDPACNQGTMPFRPLTSAFRDQVIKIMQIVQPELGPLGAIPVFGPFHAALLPDKPERRRPRLPRFTETCKPISRTRPRRWRRSQVRFGAIQPKPYPPIYLDWPQVPDGMEIAGEDGDQKAGSGEMGLGIGNYENGGSAGFGAPLQITGIAIYQAHG